MSEKPTYESLELRVRELEKSDLKCKKAEDALRESEERFRRFFMNAPLPYQSLDENGNIIEVNSTFLEILGYSQDEVIGKNFGDFLHPDYVAHFKENFPRFKAVGEVLGVEFEMVKKDGSKVLVSFNGKIQRDDQSRFLCTHCIFEDITERKRAEEMLKESEERYRTVADFTYAWEYWMSPELRFLYCSPACERITGYRAEEFENDPDLLQTITHPDDLPRVLKEFADGLLSQDVSATVQLRFRHKDGSWRFAETTGKAIRDLKGRLIVVFNTNDINDRKQAEVELSRYKHIVSSSKDMLALVDKNFIYLSANAAFLQALGMTSDELIGRTQSDVFGEAFFNTVIRPRAERCLAGENVRYQEWIQYPAAGRKYMDIAYSPYFGIEGEINGFAVTARDITEQENLMEKLMQAQKMESVGRLAGGVAHDFNNMLNVIIGFAEIAMEKVAPEDSLQADLEEIVSAGRRSVEITRQLLTFARKQVISPERIDLNETLESMLKMLRRLIGENIDLVFSPGSDLWPVLLDPSQADQLLANLSVNARDAIADVGKIAIETKNIIIDKDFCADHAGIAPGNFVLLAVSDTGCGMAPETGDKIFEPFFTTKGIGKGTGLGLATVYGIVKQNNGFIYFDSEPSQGTTFKIYLPQYQGAKTETPEITAPEISICQGETILVVEDEAPVLAIARTVLENEGYTVLTTDTPSKAICLAGQHAGRIHLLLTDVIMPEMNGRELASRLQEILPEMKILFMSGYTADVIAYHGVLNPGVHFIQKPFSSRNLATKVREVLDETKGSTFD